MAIDKIATDAKIPVIISLVAANVPTHLPKFLP
jgi:hypothetical protein